MGEPGGVLKVAAVAEGAQRTALQQTRSQAGGGLQGGRISAEAALVCYGLHVLMCKTIIDV